MSQPATPSGLQAQREAMRATVMLPLEGGARAGTDTEFSEGPGTLVSDVHRKVAYTIGLGI